MTSVSRPPFQPSAAHIKAAETVFMTMAFEQTVRPIVIAYQTTILAKHQYRIARQWVEKPADDCLILDPQSAYLLEDDDFNSFLDECREAALKAGLKVSDPGHCPLLVAENQRREAEAALLVAIADIPGLECFATPASVPLNIHTQVVDRTLRLLAPFCKNGSDILRGVVAH